MKLSDFSAAVRAAGNLDAVCDDFAAVIAASPLMTKLGCRSERVCRSPGDSTGPAISGVRYLRGVTDVIEAWSFEFEELETARYLWVTLLRGGRWSVDSTLGEGTWFTSHLRVVARGLEQRADLVTVPPSREWTTIYPALKTAKGGLFMRGRAEILSEYLAAVGDKRRLSDAAIEVGVDGLVLMAV